MSLTRMNIFAFVVAALMLVSHSFAGQKWVVYDGAKLADKNAPGQGKHIVLVSGDEEYRSEEGLPQLGKILATQHGFKCTVLFALDEKTGYINPLNQKNVVGLENLDSADLMIIATRFRGPSDEGMKHVDAYLKSGKPVIGLRTATHGFKFGKNSNYAHYSYNYNGDQSAWHGGFGRLVLGETWINHHGRHKHEAARGVLVKSESKHPILRGLKDGDAWGSSDVYGVRLPLPGDSKPLMLGEVTKREGEYDGKDHWFGMRPTDKAVKGNKKNDPMMPIAWTKSYQVPGGEKGQAFTTTLGAATDLEIKGTRRLIVNAAYYLLDLEVPKNGTKVKLVGEFKPNAYGFKKGNFFLDQKVLPSSHELK